MDGFINLLKPTGMTSHDVVKVLRRILGEKKTGHTGTLDPMAVGVLPIGLGSATKITEYLEHDFKSYRCEVKLGIVTDTGDIWGRILEDRASERKDVTQEDILEACRDFHGEIQQVPPMYSAVRVNGKHLYEYARNGEDVQVKARTITIRSLDLVDLYDDKILFDVVCSKGTYVRTICTELGEKLGCGGAMSFLARTASGRFRIEDAVTFEEIHTHLEAGKPASALLLPVDFPIGEYGRIRLDEKQAKWFVNGGHLKLSEIRLENGSLRQYYRIYGGETFLGIATVDQAMKKVVPHKVFYREL